MHESCQRRRRVLGEERASCDQHRRAREHINDTAQSATGVLFEFHLFGALLVFLIQLMRAESGARRLPAAN